MRRYISDNATPIPARFPSFTRPQLKEARLWNETVVEEEAYQLYPEDAGKVFVLDYRPIPGHLLIKINSNVVTIMPWGSNLFDMQVAVDYFTGRIMFSDEDCNEDREVYIAHTAHYGSLIHVSDFDGICSEIIAHQNALKLGSQKLLPPGAYLEKTISANQASDIQITSGEAYSSPPTWIQNGYLYRDASNYYEAVVSTSSIPVGAIAEIGHFLQHAYVSHSGSGSFASHIRLWAGAHIFVQDQSNYVWRSSLWMPSPFRIERDYGVKSAPSSIVLKFLRTDDGNLYLLAQDSEISNLCSGGAGQVALAPRYHWHTDLNSFVLGTKLVIPGTNTMPSSILIRAGTAVDYVVGAASYSITYRTTPLAMFMRVRELYT